jgi:hypothetical protein
MWTCSWLVAWLPVSWRPRVILEARQRASAWRALRAEHLKKEPECQACGRRTNLDVHHVIPVSFNPGRECDPENLITLCSSPCHIVFGHFMCYHCYNKDVRRMVADYRRAMKHRNCLERFK